MTDKNPLDLLFFSYPVYCVHPGCRNKDPFMMAEEIDDHITSEHMEDAIQLFAKENMRSKRRPPLKPINHGLSGYRGWRRCRCLICKAAKKKYAADGYKRRKGKKKGRLRYDTPDNDGETRDEQRSEDQVLLRLFDR